MIDQPMEIVINGRFLTQNVTGVQRYARELVRALDDILEDTPDIKVSILSPRLKTASPAWRNIVFRQIGRLHGHAWEQLELPLYCRGKTLFCPANTAPVVSLFTQPVIVTVHDLSYKYFPSAYHPAFRLWYKFLTPLILRHARSIITVSESERRAIIAHYPRAASHLHAIANGGMPAGLSIEPRRSADKGDNYILYVGSLSKRKNFPRIFEVACRLSRERALRFVFVGEASKSLVNSVVRLPDELADRISFVGAVNDPAELIPYYCQAECFLFPSLYESSGLPPIEAMACGCPVIVSDIPALRERCGDAAVYCDPYDANSIAAAIVRVMDNMDVRSKFSAMGYQQAKKYSWEMCARETFELLKY